MPKFEHRLKRLEKKTGMKRRKIGFLIVGVELSSEALKESLRKYKETYDDVCVIKTAVPRPGKKASKKSQVVAGDSFPERKDVADLTDDELDDALTRAQRELEK